MSDRLTPDQTWRLLHAKAAELENIFKGRMEVDQATPFDRQDTWLIADVALVFGLMANYVEDTNSSLRLYEAHTENLIERVRDLELHTGYDATLEEQS